jgi:Flp pilus assembly protein TadG
MTMPSKSESGQAIIEFSIVAVSLVALFAGAFTSGALLYKAIQVSNVTRSAAVLLVSTITNPTGGLNLADQANQRILVREASGLGLSADAQYDPSSTGTAAIFLSQVILVGDNECAAGITNIPNGVPPWSAASCPNYGKYAFAYYVAIGNTTRWSSAFGTPPAADVQSNGSISYANIASDTNDQVSTTAMTSVITLSSGQYALFSETYADVSAISVFSIFRPPVVYYRTIT